MSIVPGVNGDPSINVNGDPSRDPAPEEYDGG